MDTIHTRSSERGMVFTKWWNAVRARIRHTKKKISSDDVLCRPIERTKSQPNSVKMRTVTVREKSKSMDLVRSSCGTHILSEGKVLDVVFPNERFNKMLAIGTTEESENTATSLDMCRDWKNSPHLNTHHGAVDEL